MNQWKIRRMLFIYTGSACFLILIALGIRLYFFEPAKICQGSDCPALAQNDPSFVREWAYALPIGKDVYNIAVMFVSHDAPGFVTDVNFRFSLYSAKGEKVKVFGHPFSILSGQENILLIPNITIAREEPVRIDVTYKKENVQWRQISQRQKGLQFETQTIESVPTTRIHTNVFNTTTNPITNITPYVIAHSGNGSVVGVNSTYIDYLGRDSKKEISFVWPEKIRVRKEVCVEPMQTFVVLIGDDKQSKQYILPPEKKENTSTEKNPINICTSSGGEWLSFQSECEFQSIGDMQGYCTQVGGIADSCSSACRNNPFSETCTQQCVPVCSVNTQKTAIKKKTSTSMIAEKKESVFSDLLSEKTVVGLCKEYKGEWSSIYSECKAFSSENSKNSYCEKVNGRDASSAILCRNNPFTLSQCVEDIEQACVVDWLRQEKTETLVQEKKQSDILKKNIIAQVEILVGDNILTRTSVYTNKTIEYDVAVSKTELTRHKHTLSQEDHMSLFHLIQTSNILNTKESNKESEVKTLPCDIKNETKAKVFFRIDEEQKSFILCEKYGDAEIVKKIDPILSVLQKFITIYMEETPKSNTIQITLPIPITAEKINYLKNNLEKYNDTLIFFVFKKIPSLADMRILRSLHSKSYTVHIATTPNKSTNNERKLISGFFAQTYSKEVTPDFIIPFQNRESRGCFVEPKTTSYLFSQEL